MSHTKSKAPHWLHLLSVPYINDNKTSMNQCQILFFCSVNFYDTNCFPAHLNLGLIKQETSKSTHSCPWMGWTPLDPWNVKFYVDLALMKLFVCYLSKIHQEITQWQLSYFKFLNVTEAEFMMWMSHMQDRKMKNEENRF